MLMQPILSGAQELPGVRNSAFATVALLRGLAGFGAAVGLPGDRMPQSSSFNSTYNVVSPGYFDTMSMRILAGRGFAPATGASKEAILPVVVNQAFARRFFPGQDPVGKFFGVADDVGAGGGGLKPTREIVGVVSDARYRNVREPVPPAFYVRAAGRIVSILHVRATGDPAALVAPVRELVKKVAPGWQIREVNLLRDEEERSIWREKLVAHLAIGFACVAGLLAAIGLYGTLAYYVSRNRRGIGIRVAIGAARANIVELLAGRVARLIGAGVVMGLVASFALSGWVRAMLFGVGPSDPVSMGVAAAVLILIAVAALLLPAWRAMRIDPAVTLREE